MRKTESEGCHIFFTNFNWRKIITVWLKVHNMETRLFHYTRGTHKIFCFYFLCPFWVWSVHFCGVSEPHYHLSNSLVTAVLSLLLAFLLQSLLAALRKLKVITVVDPSSLTCFYMYRFNHHNVLCETAKWMKFGNSCLFVFYVFVFFNFMWNYLNIFYLIHLSNHHLQLILFTVTG